MDDEELIATRESFGNAIVELDNKNIVVLDADLDTATKTKYFAEKYPDRFIEMGISENDMVGTAAGLATAGKIPFASSFASFITGRCYDQIRCSIAYPKLNVKLVGSHYGITVGEDGATHQMLEDISLMRTLPNMTVLCPADDISCKKLVENMAEFDGPVYMRVSRYKTPIIYDEEDKFEIGKGYQIGEGCDATIFATGDVVFECLEAQDTLKEMGINVRVCDMYSLKPIDKDLIIKCAKETKILFSVEDHSIIGGLGSAISEVLTTDYPKKLKRIGINDTFGKSGKAEDLLKYFKLDHESIVEKVLEEIDDSK